MSSNESKRFLKSSGAMDDEPFSTIPVWLAQVSRASDFANLEMNMRCQRTYTQHSEASINSISASCKSF